MATVTGKLKFQASILVALLLGSSSLVGAAGLRAQKPTLTVRPAPAAHFDEVFFRVQDSSGEEYAVVRPEYRDVVRAVRDLTKSELTQIHRNTKADFHGDNVLSAVPRILLSSEYDGILKRGVDQRGRALRSFLEDYYRNDGHPRFVKSGHMEQSVLDTIVARSLEMQFRNRVNPNAITALYGPDVIRDVHGVFRVVEDNTGFIGGMGDLELALKALTARVDGLDGLKEREPLEFYKELVARYRQRAVPAGGRLVVVQVPPYADFEDRRLMSLMKRIGVDVVTPFTKSKLEFDASGAWFREKRGAPREPVGFLYLNGEHWWLDMKHPLVEQVAVTEYSKLVQDELREKVQKGKKLKKKEKRFLKTLGERDHETGFPDVEKLRKQLVKLHEWDELDEWRSRSFPGLLDAVLDGKVASNYTPGTNFINDKEFYLFVPEMIRYYLGEEPILQNIKTYDPRMKDGSGRADLDFLARVEREQKKFVIKVVDGRGGKGIWVGPKVSKRDFRVGLDAVRAEPERYKIQEYTALSVKGDEIVDSRVPADLPPSGRLFVSDIGWGRSLPLSGDGKVNLSATGRETTIIVRSAGPFCKDLFQPTPAEMIFKLPR